MRAINGKTIAIFLFCLCNTVNLYRLVYHGFVYKRWSECSADVFKDGEDNENFALHGAIISSEDEPQECVESLRCS